MSEFTQGVPTKMGWYWFSADRERGLAPVPCRVLPQFDRDKNAEFGVIVWGRPRGYSNPPTKNGQTDLFRLDDPWITTAWYAPMTAPTRKP